MWNLKYDTNELIYKTEIYRHRKQTYGYQRGKMAEMDGYIKNGSNIVYSVSSWVVSNSLWPHRL